MYSNKKNFLIVTASIGAGHNRAAEAIGNEIKIKYPQAEIHIVDFMSTKTAYLNGILKEAYLKMLSLVPDMYEFLYSFTRGKLQGVSVQSLLALAMKNDMASLVRRYNADVVICTHPFPCAAAAYLKKTKQIDAVLSGVITDFSIHQLWVYKEVDLYFVGNSALRSELTQKGIDAWRIYDTGIPIDTYFNQNYNKIELIEKMQLDEISPIILVMGGGLGLGGVNLALQSLETIDVKVQIIVVAGENQNLWLDLKAQAGKSKHMIQVWGFSNNVQELMAVSTILISKPGALTISEALAMELPMILNEPIPGQEKENAAYVESIGAAIWVKDSTKLADVVAGILTNPEKLIEMRHNARQFKKPNAANDIVEKITNYIDKQEDIVAGM
ncbi:MGDG synthase family glycosyltransferase [Anaerosinus massiliensis]|uniref:MGDG synthase family glycosyltransferase n=1 Tax=Massilibacillus massiliensis TaxID=1806837 RepID=UPI000A9438DC|nr:glycosyltransferase [Massilibacillus massiliensis]